MTSDSVVLYIVAISNRHIDSTVDECYAM